MLEIVKALIEPVAKSISVDGLVEARKKRKAHEIGTELFLLYTSLNDILVVGRHIIDELNRAATWMKRKVEEGEPDREYHVPLEFWLRQQRVNILKLVASVKRLGLELQVISPETYVQLAPLIHGKFNAVNRLLQAISGTGRHTSMLVSTDAEKMLEVLRNAEVCAAKTRGCGQCDSNQDRRRDRYYGLESRARAVAKQSVSYWDWENLIIYEPIDKHELHTGQAIRYNSSIS